MTAAPTVVLLHGLARRRGSLAGLGRALAAGGFATWAIDYPSRRLGIAAAAAAVADQLAADLPDRPLMAVTHSLGGVLWRHLADRRLCWQRGVMLAPPNQGSQLAATFARHPLFRWFYGPAGQELAAAAAWPAPPAPTMVIAGTRRRALVNPTSWVSGRVFDPAQDHDGTVAVDETRLPDLARFERVDATHTTIMDDATVRALVLAFVRGA